jgi:hypothetical protein
MARVNHLLTKEQTIRDFISTIRDHCSEYGVSVRFTKGKQLNSGEGQGRYYGYFYEPVRKKNKGKSSFFRDGEIKIATGEGETVWVHTLAHEYAHFLHWLKRRKFWIHASESQHEKAAEKTAIRLLKKYNVGVDLRVIKASSNRYIKKYYGKEN